MSCASPTDMKTLQQVLLEHQYKLGMQIGKGAYGTCYVVESLKYKQLFVGKVLEYYEGNVGSRNEKTYELEVQALLKLSHPNIVKLYDYFAISKYMILIFEYCEGGTFLDLIKSKSPLLKSNFTKYIYELISALDYSHNNGIAHLDIKPANLFLDKYGHLKLADFGLSQYCNQGSQLQNLYGSIAYMPPEMIRKKPYDPFKADIWSLGITIYQIVTKQIPWMGMEVPKAVVEMEKGIKFDDETVPLQIRNIVKMCCHPDPKMRPTPSTLLAQIKIEYLKIEKSISLVMTKKRKFNAISLSCFSPPPPPLRRKGGALTGRTPNFFNNI